MKKYLCSVLCLAMLLSVALVSGCKKPETEESKVEESQAETQAAFGDKTVEAVMDELIAKAKELDTDEFGLNSLEDAEREMVLQNTVLTAEYCETVLGLSEDEFAQYVDTAVENSLTNASWMTYSTVLVKLKDGVDAAAVAEKIIANTNPRRFGCLTPSCIQGGYTGQYVYFMAFNDISCAAFDEAVKALSAASVKTISRDNDWSGGFFF